MGGDPLMPREYARLRLDMWITGDIRKLTPPAQHLYFVLLTSPDLSYCGVADWRPGRIAAAAEGWTADQVRAAGEELARGLYVVVDEQTEEVLVRSFIRNDGLMKEARVAVSMVKAFGAVASSTLRGVIVHELRRLHVEDPSLNGWRTTKGERGQALALLELEDIDPADLDTTLGVGLPHGFGVGLAETSTNVRGSVSGSTSPAPTPAPTPEENTTAPRKRGCRIPDDFAVTEEMHTWATDQGFGHLDLDKLTVEFRDYWLGVAGQRGVKLDWPATWRNRVRAVAERTPAAVAAGTSNRPSWEL